MDDFETFKTSRVKMDPSSRKMTDHQWKQSYAAYRSARERVGVGSVSVGKAKRRRKSKSVNSSGSESSLRGARGPSTVSGLGNLRQVVRQQSAYADLRLIIDILAWVAIALFILIAVVSMFFYTSAPVAIIALLWAGVQIIGAVLVRLLVHVLVDIPDIALYQSLQKSIGKTDIA
jgi:hypothetical protein